MDEELLIIRISDTCVKHTKHKASLIFLDSFAAHVTEKVKDAFKKSSTTVVVVQGRCAPIVQLLDVSIKKIKSHQKSSWVQYMLEQTSGQTLKKKKNLLFVDWIEEVNNILNSNSCIIKKSFFSYRRMRLSSY